MKPQAYYKFAKLTNKEGQEIRILSQLYLVGLYTAVYVPGHSIPVQLTVLPKKQVQVVEKCPEGFSIVESTKGYATKVNGFWQEVPAPS